MNAEQNKFLNELYDCGTDAGMFVDPKDAVVASCVKAGFAETNETMKNPTGEIACRITPTGMEAIGKTPAFAVESGISIPEPERRKRATGTRASKYPFDELEIGQSFFVEDEGDKPAIGKMAASVSNANTRHSTEHPTKTRIDRKGNTVPVRVPVRHFIVRQMDGGCRIWRTKLPEVSDEA